MATILLVEDAPDLGLYEARLLEAEGHRVIRCSGGPTIFAACRMMRDGFCPLPDSADLIVFSCGLFAPIRHRTYRGIHLLRAYRAHPRYGRLPMLVVSFGPLEKIEGADAIEIVEKFAGPQAVLDAVGRLLARSVASAPSGR